MDNTKTLVTEQLNDKSNNIDRKNSIDILRIINQEDQTVPKIIENHLEEINLVVERVVHAFKKGGRLFYIGAGTSGRLGVLDASECPPTYGTDPSMVQGIIAGGEDAMFKPVEGVEDSENEGIKDVEKADLRSEDIMIGITASGRAPYVIGALKKAREEGITTVSFTCNHESELNNYGDYLINIEVGPEVVTGSTRMKAGTVQKLVLNMITTSAMILLGKVYGNLMVDVQPLNKKLVSRCKRIIAYGTGCTEKEAELLYYESNQNPKVAIVMYHTGVSRVEAEEMLEEHNGFVYKAIGEAHSEEFTP